MEVKMILAKVDDVLKDVNLPHVSVDSVVLNILNTTYAVAGVVAVGFIIYGGITYATSLGEPAKVKQGTMALIYSIVGLIIVLIAAAITNFVLGAV